MQNRIHIDLAADSYDIVLERGVLDRAGELIRNAVGGAKAYVLTDRNVSKHYGARVCNALQQAGYEVKLCALPAGEKTKSLEVLPDLYGQLAGFGINRSDVFVALGGGVIGDLGGFAAATYLRGIPLVQLPTSLLAQVDSSVGGKVAVDLPEGKNLVGSFYQPKLVLIDVEVLRTLPDRYWADGMGEVIKYAATFDEGLFEVLEHMPGRECVMGKIDQIVQRCCEIKARIVEQDERDLGERMKLNFGHTLGHAIEVAQAYAGLSHGEAVAVGMYWITRLSENRGITEAGTYGRLERLIFKHGLPSKIKLQHPRRAMKALEMDKKNLDGRLTLVLLDRIGSCILHKVNAEFLREVEQWVS